MVLRMEERVGDSTAAGKGRARPADAVHSRMFAGELVILDMEGGAYFTLDEIGAALWSGLEAGKTLEQVAEEVVARYQVELPQALADLTALRDELLDRGLLVNDDHEPR